MKTLSIIITAHNEGPALAGTVDSILATVPDRLDEIEIIVVDDASTKPVELPRNNHLIEVIRNPARIGVGASRQAGAMVTCGEWLLFTDAHMDFSACPGWFGAFQSGCVNPRVVYCGTYCSQEQQNVIEPVSAGGARFFFLKRNGDGTNRFLDLEPLLEPENAPESYQVPALIGAAYFVNKNYFRSLYGFAGLAGWGGDELLLSLKSWRCGEGVRCLRDVRIAHIAQEQKDLIENPSVILANKLFIYETCLDYRTRQRLAPILPRSPDWAIARNLLASRWALIKKMSHWCAIRSRLSISELCAKLDIESPEETAAIGYAE